MKAVLVTNVKVSGRSFPDIECGEAVWSAYSDTPEGLLNTYASLNTLSVFTQLPDCRVQGSSFQVPAAPRSGSRASFLIGSHAISSESCLHDYSEGILHVCQSLSHGVAFGNQFWQQRRSNGVAPFRLRLQDRGYSQLFSSPPVWSA